MKDRTMGTIKDTELILNGFGGQYYTRGFLSSELAPFPTQISYFLTKKLSQTFLD